MFGIIYTFSHLYTITICILWLRKLRNKDMEEQRHGVYFHKVTERGPSLA